MTPTRRSSAAVVSTAAVIILGGVSAAALTGCTRGPSPASIGTVSTPAPEVVPTPSVQITPQPRDSLPLGKHIAPRPSPTPTPQPAPRDTQPLLHLPR